MSELKAYNTKYEQVLDEVYLKSEADEVIAELKAQKVQAEDDCAYWKSKYKECKRELDLLKDTNAFYNGEKK
jgi:hypothetical protein